MIGSVASFNPQAVQAHKTNPTNWLGGCYTTLRWKQEGQDWLVVSSVWQLKEGPARKCREGLFQEKLLIEALIHMKTGEQLIRQHVHSAFISPAPGYEGHDICYYCGSSNGVGGTHRVGYDCCLCGGN